MEKLKRAGHIPTAVNKDVKHLYSRNEGICSLKDLAELERLYQDLRGRKVYTYCNTGRSASLSYLVLRSLKVDVAVYDGSWTEWSADESLPVELGIEPGRPR